LKERCRSEAMTEAVTAVVTVEIEKDPEETTETDTEKTDVTTKMVIIALNKRAGYSPAISYT